MTIGPGEPGAHGELLRVDILAGRVYRARVDEKGGLVPVRTYRVMLAT